MRDELFDAVSINPDGTRFTRPPMVDGLDRIWTHDAVGDAWSCTEHDGEPMSFRALTQLVGTVWHLQRSDPRHPDNQWEGE